MSSFGHKTKALQQSDLVKKIILNEADPDVQLLIPVSELNQEPPLVTVLVPAMNEEITITTFMQWCYEGIEGLEDLAEIVIIDSSDDKTPQRVLELGGRVLRAPKRGLGRAYIDAFPFARGEYLILGDADCTYDFRQLKPFVDRLKQGADFVIGSRFSGTIENGAMPKTHRYFGTPVTTWLLNRIYGTSYSDIHCGMRAVSRRGLEKIDLQSQSWEYASEMVIKAAVTGLTIEEVPINFFKDRDGRVSVHRREGWFSPIKAAWINIQAMMLYGGNRLARAAAYPLLAAGAMLVLLTFFGPLGSLGLAAHSTGWALFICGMALKLGDSIFEMLWSHNLKVLTKSWSHWLLQYDRAMLTVNGLFWPGLSGLLIYGLLALSGRGSSAGLYWSINFLGFMMVSVVLFIFAVLYQVIVHQTQKIEKED